MEQMEGNVERAQAELEEARDSLNEAQEEIIAASEEIEHLQQDLAIAYKKISILEKMAASASAGGGGAVVTVVTSSSGALGDEDVLSKLVEKVKAAIVHVSNPAVVVSRHVNDYVCLVALHLGDFSVERTKAR
jgi:chromosome segregation ATPase